MIFSVSHFTSLAVSLDRIPIKTTSPGPIVAVVVPPITTEARLARCTTARIFSPPVA